MAVTNFIEATMCQFLTNNFAAVLNSAGIIFVMIGAWLVAYEVVNKFKGEPYHKHQISFGASLRPIKTDEYINWEIIRSKVMVSGLVCITIGSLLQIISIWV